MYNPEKLWITAWNPKFAKCLFRARFSAFAGCLFHAAEGIVDQHDPSWCARLRAPSRPRDTPPPPSAPRPVDRADFDPHFDPKAPVVCEICGGVMRYTAACKLACGNYGYKRDCSDP